MFGSVAQFLPLQFAEEHPELAAPAEPARSQHLPGMNRVLHLKVYVLLLPASAATVGSLQLLLSCFAVPGGSKEASLHLVLEMKHAPYTLVLPELAFQPASWPHFASELDFETFGGVARVAGVHAATVAVVLQVLAVVLVAVAVAEALAPLFDFADAFVGSFLVDLLLPRVPHPSSEMVHRRIELMAYFPHCIPAPLSLARRDGDTAVTLTESAQSDVESFHPG